MKKIKRKYIILSIIILVVLAIFGWTLWGNTALYVNNIEIVDSNFPKSFSNFKIAHVSDLHNVSFGENNSKLLNQISEAKPNIIVITGDIIDSNHTNVDVAVNFSKMSVEIAPTYYVSGNHEALKGNYDELKSRLIDVGVIILDNEYTTLVSGEESITLMGLQDFEFFEKGSLLSENTAYVSTNLKKLCENISGYKILLSHRPEYFDCYVDNDINLVFSGHAHGGQFRLPFIGGLVAPGQGLFPKYDAGVFNKNNTNMIVSKGLGNSVIPLRFNNRPELIILTLKIS